MRRGGDNKNKGEMRAEEAVEKKFEAGRKDEKI